MAGLRIERVFPIRILSPKSVDEVAPGIPKPLIESFETVFASQQVVSREPPSTAESLLQHVDLPSGDQKDDSPMISTSQNLGTTLGLDGRYVSNTFDYLSSNAEPPPSTTATEHKIYRCEDEPIHIPGAVQSFGALIALREDDGRFLVRIASENTENITGLLPEALFELRCFTDLLARTDSEEFLSRVQGIKTSEGIARTKPDVFSLSLIPPQDPPRACFVAMHWSAESDLVVCELELKDDIFNPQRPPHELFPAQPIETVNGGPAESERLLSTTTRSKPLRAVRIARKSSRQVGSMELFQVLCEIQEQMAFATDLQTLLDIIVGLVHDLTGFHRVMVYQFDETAAGFVQSEIVDPRASKDIYRGLKFPAADIPKQARALYLINKIRVLYDREQTPARLLCRTKSDAATPLDLKHSYLRAMSPIHLKYLENMGVRASMSISLTVGDKLWGLISCHCYGSGMRVALPIRELLRALGDLASTNIEKLIYATRIKARKPLLTEPKRSPSSYIAASSTDLLQVFGADFGFLAIKGEARTIGKMQAYPEAIVLLQYVRQKAYTSIFSSQYINKDCADIHYPRGFSIIAGILVIPLTLTLTGSDFLIFFRRGQVEEVQWAGNPNEAKQQGDTYLQPRASFKRWSEKVVGRSREWTDDQIESAVVLSTLYSRFIEVWRQKEAIVQQNRMTRLLIRNSGHEVRTPLNSIIGYLEVALEETLDEGARQHLQRSLQASKSLVWQVEHLLHLTNVEESNSKGHEENVNLVSIINEVVDSFRISLMVKGLDIKVEADEGVSKVVRSDLSMLRQVILNLLANAVQHSRGDLICVRLENISSTETTTQISLSFQDDGCGMSESELDSLFQEFEQVLDDDENEVADPPEDLEESAKQLQPVSLGLGLALAARFARLNGGQIVISSEKDLGTKVSIQIPFRLGSADGSLCPKSASPLTPLLTPEVTPALSRLSGLQRAKTENSGIAFQQTLADVNESVAESLASIAQAVSLSTEASFGPTTGGYPFPLTNLIREKYSVLVAEDNPLNSRLLETRLLKRGHSVRVTADGQACAELFKSTPGAFDVILMDLQMPLVDGNTSTRLIRAFESQNSSPLSAKVTSYGRIPIIAVSASLSEKRSGEYVECGFDGWILKPIDFTRLEAIIAAIQDEDVRASLVYGVGNWNQGGWFKCKLDDPGSWK